MRTLILALVALLLVSCKTTAPYTLTPINTGVDTTWTGLPEAQVLVMMQMESRSIRVLFEDEMVKTLQAEGVYALASHTVVSSFTSLTKEKVNQFLAASPQRAVLFCRATMVNKRRNSSAVKEQSTLDALTDDTNWEVTFNAQMEDALYVHGHPRAVWWNRVNVLANEKKLYQAAEQFVKNEIQALRDSGVIERLK